MLEHIMLVLGPVEDDEGIRSTRSESLVETFIPGYPMLPDCWWYFEDYNSETEHLTWMRTYL